jgi:NifU-like protein involved in Fe-S cluster formation
MLDEIYNKRVLELAADIPRLGRLTAPDATAKAHSRLCGSTVIVDLSVCEGHVSDFAHDVRACALGQASSSLMARHVIGATPDELAALRETMLAMLKQNGPPPSGKWSEFSVLAPVKDFKARHASTMLTFDAVVDALGQIAAAEKRAEGRSVASAAS